MRKNLHAIVTRHFKVHRLLSQFPAGAAYRLDSLLQPNAVAFDRYLDADIGKFGAVVNPMTRYLSLFRHAAEGTPELINDAAQ